MNILNDVEYMLGNSMQMLRSLLVLAMIPMLIHCFFGYKIQKILITLGGICVGAVSGIVIGIISGEQVVLIGAALLLAILCGFIAFKLYKFGIFLQFWLLGTLAFAVLFLCMGVFEGIGFAVILGLIIGVLALVLHKGFVIITTAVSGGMIAGMGMGYLLRMPGAAGIFIGIVLSVFGAIVQFSMEKKKKPEASPTGEKERMSLQDAVAPATNHYKLPPDLQPNAKPGEKKLAHTVLSSVIPEYYCPKSKVLLDLVTLSKDDAEEVYLSFDYSYLGEDNLAAIYFKVKGYGIAGEDFGEQEYSLIDLDIAPNTKGHSAAVRLENNAIRKVELVLTKTVNCNFEVTAFEESDTLELPVATPIKGTVNAATEELLKLAPDEKYFYAPLADGLWRCTCGHIGYHVCSGCGRNDSQLLKHTDAEIAGRIAANINQLLETVEHGTTLHELDEQKSEIENAMELLAGKEDLLEDCRQALDKIAFQKDEIHLREKKRKKKRKKRLIITLSCVAAVVLVTIAVKFVTELPPSDGKIRKDVEACIAESFGETYTIQEVESVKYELSEGYKVVVDAEIQNEQNNDLLKVSVTLKYFDKNYGRYQNTYRGVDHYTTYPVHGIGEEDVFDMPDIRLVCGNSTERINAYNAEELMADGSLMMEYEIRYSDIVLAENKTEVPVTIHLDYLNASVDTEIMASYCYCGDYYWKPDESVEVSAAPNGELLDAARIEWLVREAKIYYPYEDEILSGEYVSFVGYEIEYYAGYTMAEVYGEVRWDNSRDRFDGIVMAMFEFSDGAWNLDEIWFEDVTEPVRYAAMSDSEMIDILAPIIAENCSENQNVRNILLSDIEENGDGITVKVTYDSENGNYLLKNSVTVLLTDSVAQGYVFDWLSGESVRMTGLKEEIHEKLPVNYRLSCNNATPNGVPSSGTTELKLDMDYNGNVQIQGSIGEIYLNLNGKAGYPNADIAINEFEQSVNINYSFLIRLNSNITFRVTPSFAYSDGRLTGSMSYKSIAIGAGDFVIFFE